MSERFISSTSLQRPVDLLTPVVQPQPFAAYYYLWALDKPCTPESWVSPVRRILEEYGISIGDVGNQSVVGTNEALRVLVTVVATSAPNERTWLVLHVFSSENSEIESTFTAIRDSLQRISMIDCGPALNPVDG